MGNGKSLQKIVKLRKLAKLVKIRETAAIPAEPAKKKPNKIKQTPSPEKRTKKKLKKCEAMRKKNNKKIHHKLPLNVNGKSGQKLLDCRCRRCAARDGELPSCRTAGDERSCRKMSPDEIGDSDALSEMCS